VLKQNKTSLKQVPGFQVVLPGLAIGCQFWRLSVQIGDKIVTLAWLRLDLNLATFWTSFEKGLKKVLNRFRTGSTTANKNLILETGF
jgi:hypothetical protein